VREYVVSQTRTQRGRALVERLVPYGCFETIAREQQRTRAMRDLEAPSEISILPAIDTAEFTQLASQGGALGPRELRLIAEALAAASSAYRAVRSDSVLCEAAAGYVGLDDLRAAIDNAIDLRDAVLDRASPALSRIRRNLAQAQSAARERVQATIRSASYAKAIQDPVVTIREGRFVVPVKAEFAKEFPGIVHDASASGQTLFIEPLAALETNNRLRTLRVEEEREVERILAELSRHVGERAAAIETNVDVLAAIDVLAAKARVARTMDAVEPELGDAAELRVVNGRHPLLGERAVPQSLHLDEEIRLIVISGPNMGGKTVALKMAGLLVAMAYMGMQIPASLGSRVGRFARVVADIGDEQSIAANVSTFAGHLDRMRDALAAADEGTLVLVDEIGGGTEPSAGAALAIAMLERMLAVRARAIVTTHATELKLFAHRAQGTVNASVRFDPESFAPTYHLDLGAPGQSLAFTLARARGLDAAVVERAESLLESQERDYERALQELGRRNAELQIERQRLSEARRTAENAQREAERRATELGVEREQLLLRAQERLQRALREFSSELQQREGLRRPKITAGQSNALAQTLEAMRRDLGIGHEDDASRQRARLSAPLSGTARRAESEPARFEAAAGTSSELDVRGKRYAEAEPLVDRWIDNAILAGSSPLRLIHGKGTGALGRGLQAFLKEHPAVASARYGSEEEGSTGVTIIELR
jgi:DNA mismatch repair protein MutS2